MPISPDFVMEVPAEPAPVEAVPSIPVDYSSFVPEAGFTTAGDAVPDTALVKRLFALGYADQCNLGGSIGDTDLEFWDLSYRDSYQQADEPDRTFSLYQFDCDAGAYNFSSVFLTWDSVSGLVPLWFATPSFEVSYENDRFDGKVLGVAYKGMRATNLMVNAWFDPETRGIGSYAKWRGIGDASDGGTWVQAGPDFILDTYDVDASYNDTYDPWRIVAGRKVLDVPEQIPPEPFDVGTKDQTDAQ